GNVFYGLGCFDEAVAAYDKALAINPGLAEAWVGRGNASYERKEFNEAFAAYDRALALDSDLVEAWVGRGNVFHLLNHFDEAVAAYDKALASNRSLDYVGSARLNATQSLCDWTAFEAGAAELLSTMRERKSINYPFVIISVPSSAAAQLECAECYVQ